MHISFIIHHAVVNQLKIDYVAMLIKSYSFIYSMSMVFYFSRILAESIASLLYYVTWLRVSNKQPTDSIKSTTTNICQRISEQYKRNNGRSEPEISENNEREKDSVVIIKPKNTQKNRILL